MERKDSSKIIAIVALVLAIVGVSIGFAAFSNTLTIKSTAAVSPDEDTFDVNFSSTSGTETDGDVVASPAEDSSEVYKGATATIDNSTNAPTITGLHADFTKPGQKVTYSFYAHNNGEYIAYLNSITFANVTGATATKVCTAAEGTSQALVDTACSDIVISVKVGDQLYDGSAADISGHSLVRDAYEPIVVSIEYKTNENVNVADGDFTVAFGDISLVYSSVD